MVAGFLEQTTQGRKWKLPGCQNRGREMGTASLLPHSVGQAVPEPRFMGRGCRPHPVMRVLTSCEIFPCVRPRAEPFTCCLILFSQEFDLPVPRVASRKPNNRSKFTWWETESSFVSTVRALNHGADLCVRGPVQSECGRARIHARICLTREHVRL